MLRFLRLPARIPVRLPVRQTNQKLLAALVFAMIAIAIAYAVRGTRPVERFKFLLYDTAFTLRESSDRSGSDVVIIAVDQDSLTKMDQGVLGDEPVSWPWPRSYWGDIVTYLQQQGAKVVAFDLLFSETDKRAKYGADEMFADAVNDASIQVVFGTQVSEDGKPGRFAPPVKHPTFGAVNVIRPGVLRTHAPLVHGFPSLAYRAAELFQGSPPSLRDEFYVHYYGHSTLTRKATTYRYVPAVEVLAAASGKRVIGFDERVFKGKVVLIGATAPGTFDAKSSPLDDVFPGVEWQATAIENILFYQRVQPVPEWVAFVYTLLGTLLAAGGAVLPRRAVMKIVAIVFVLVAVTGTSLFFFIREPIHWLPLAVPLIAIAIASLMSLAWSYFTEGRQRLFFSNAFALATSPEVATAIDRDPDRIRLGGQRREVTIMFTDLAGFTDFAESMEVEKLTRVIQTYMEAMSEVIVKQGGYLDKYVGDAIMSTWNGLLDQAGHAESACRAAIGIKRREIAIAQELKAETDAKIVTRIGVHTGRVAFGNLGSSRKLQITVLGDSVNLAARLEPANKLYDTEVMISQSTAEQVRGKFVMRELDLLAVKGKTIPMAVYELIAEGAPSPSDREKIELYAAGLAHYRSQRWDEAEAAWTQLLQRFPGDGPAAKMLARVAKLRHEHLPAEWDGVYRSKEK